MFHRFRNNFTIIIQKSYAFLLISVNWPGIFTYGDEIMSAAAESHKGKALKY